VAGESVVAIKESFRKKKLLLSLRSESEGYPALRAEKAMILQSNRRYNGCPQG
jgi:hypothetical protein